MRVIFIGNSHTYFNDMPQTFAEIWTSAFGDTPDITMLAYSNRSLQWHSDEYFALRFNLLYGNYDVCVIQQSAHPFPGYEATKNGIQTILRLCRKANVKPFLYMPWCEQRFPENQDKITSALRRIATEECMDAIPVGDVWQEIQRRMPEVPLYWTDGEHASVTGDYLIAVTMCMAISNKTDVYIDASAHDFSHGIQIDFEHPMVCENKKETICNIPQNIADEIVASAKSVIHKKAYKLENE